MAVAEAILVAPTHIYIGTDGKARVEGTGIKVSFLTRSLKLGLTAEQIQEGFPQLSLAQIYAAWAYYYDHQREYDELLAEQDRIEAELRRQAENDPWRKGLAERLRAAQQQP